MLIRQGDVMIQSVATVPASGTELKHATLAEGEVTGHCHRIENPSDVKLFDVGGTLYLRVYSATAALVHQEHGTLQIPLGDYKVWRQREYTPAEIRTVRD